MAADVEAVLVADEGEAGAEFEEEIAQVGDEGFFEFALADGGADVEELEVERVFDQLASEIGLGIGQGGGEVVVLAGGAQVEFALDLVDEDGARPAVFGGLGGVPEAEGGGFEFFDERNVVSPGDCKEGRRTPAVLYF